jgi:Concanavalin A-like lectin/glucanases superfamily
MLDSAVMRGAVLTLVLSACGFTGSGGGTAAKDAKVGSIDASVVDAVVNPNAPDAMPDGPPPPQRVTANLLALYEFNDAVDSTTIKDGAENPTDLQLAKLNTNGTATFDGQRLSVDQVYAYTPLQPTTMSNKFTTCHSGMDSTLNDELTIEAWVTAGPAPAAPLYSQLATLVKGNVFQTATSPATIDAGLRQTGEVWTGQVRSPTLVTSQRTIDVSSETQIVYVVAPGDSGYRSFYINGQARGNPLALPGTFNAWSSIGVMLFAEIERYSSRIIAQRPWKGSIARLAIYCRALTPAEIMTHFKIGAEGSHL